MKEITVKKINGIEIGFSDYRGFFYYQVKNLVLVKAENGGTYIKNFTNRDHTFVPDYEIQDLIKLINNEDEIFLGILKNHGIEWETPIIQSHLIMYK